jgi:mannose/fructose/N-acetylgalactosamine-specific phosphotransferase system component IID
MLKKLIVVAVCLLVLSWGLCAAPESSTSQSIDQALADLQTISQNDQRLQALSDQMTTQLQKLELSYSASKLMNKIWATSTIILSAVVVGETTYLIWRK